MIDFYQKQLNIFGTGLFSCAKCSLLACFGSCHGSL